jgi:hypothetical protein
VFAPRSAPRVWFLPSPALGPESIAFVSAEESPTGDALLVVGNEVSGTTAIFRVRPLYGLFE